MNRTPSTVLKLDSTNYKIQFSHYKHFVSDNYQTESTLRFPRVAVILKGGPIKSCWQLKGGSKKEGVQEIFRFIRFMSSKFGLYSCFHQHLYQLKSGKHRLWVADYAKRNYVKNNSTDSKTYINRSANFEALTVRGVTLHRNRRAQWKNSGLSYHMAFIYSTKIITRLRQNTFTVIIAFISPSSFVVWYVVPAWGHFTGTKFKIWITDDRKTLIHGQIFRCLTKKFPNIRAVTVSVQFVILYNHMVSEIYFC